MIERMKHFFLLRTALENGKTPEDLIGSTHVTTRCLARFIEEHWFTSTASETDIIDLWRRLDAEGRAELVRYLYDVVG